MKLKKRSLNLFQAALFYEMKDTFYPGLTTLPEAMTKVG